MSNVIHLSNVKPAPGAKDPELPDFCFGVHPSSGEIVGIRNGVIGFVSFSSAVARELSIREQRDRAGCEAWVKAKNEALGVSEKQAVTMMGRSMFGWRN